MPELAKETSQGPIEMLYNKLTNKKPVTTLNVKELLDKCGGD